MINFVLHEKSVHVSLLRLLSFVNQPMKLFAKKRREAESKRCVSYIEFVHKYEDKPPTSFIRKYMNHCTLYSFPSRQYHHIYAVNSILVQIIQLRMRGVCIHCSVHLYWRPVSVDRSVINPVSSVNTPDVCVIGWNWLPSDMNRSGACVVPGDVSRSDERDWTGTKR